VGRQIHMERLGVQGIHIKSKISQEEESNQFYIYASISLP
jgi:hypothetical protein